MDPDRNLRRRMIGAFVLQGILPASTNLRIPDLQIDLGLNDAELGFALMGAPIGALLIFPLSALIVNRLGTRLTIAISYMTVALLSVVLTLATGGVSLFLALLVMGAAYSTSNIAINVEADRVELFTGRRLMSLCHGMWSVVFMATSGLSGLVRGLGVSPLAHIATVSTAMLVLTVLLVLPLRESPPRAFEGQRSRRFAPPTAAILGLVVFGIGGDLLEGASRVWATIFMRDSFDVPAFVESMGLFSLIAAMALTRLVADRFIERHGPRSVGRLALAVAFAGVLLLVVAPAPGLALLGFLVAGLGAGVIYPLMISSAARLHDRPAEENVASLTFIFQTLMLLAPMAVGLISQSLGVRAAYGLLLPLLALGWWAAGKLQPPRPA